MQHISNAVLVAAPVRPNFDRAEFAARAFLVRYRVEHTRQAYGTAFRQWFDYCRFLDIDPLDAQRPHVELFQRHLEQLGRAPATVSAKTNALSIFYRYAVIDGHCEKDPTLAVTRPHVERKSRSSMFTRGEIADMLAAAEKLGPRAHALVTVLSHTGMRISEVLQIDVEHVAEVRGQIAVSVLRKGGKRQLVTFAPTTGWVVRQLLDARTDAGPLFITGRGNRMDRKCASTILKNLARSVGITKRVHPHAFRKTMATLARNAGIPDREVIALAGWADGRMLEYYDGGKDTLQANATQALAVFIDRAG